MNAQPQSRGPFAGGTIPSDEWCAVHDPRLHLALPGPRFGRLVVPDFEKRIMTDKARWLLDLSWLPQGEKVDHRSLELGYNVSRHGHFTRQSPRPTVQLEKADAVDGGRWCVLGYSAGDGDRP